jgi:hypothetical protein
MGVGDSLRGYTIPAPCPMDWAQMRGDERSRFCGASGRHVYDLTVLSSDDAAALICARNGPTCVRLYWRIDGTLMLSASQNAAQLRGGLFRFTIRSVMVVIAGVAGLLGIGRLFGDFALQSRRTTGRIMQISAPANGPGNGESNDVPIQSESCTDPAPLQATADAESGAPN